MTTMELQRPELNISLNQEKLLSLVKSNISCHFNKNLSNDLIDALTQQIVESIDFFLNQKGD